MSGLIWAGIGKGIADAGSTVGNMMFKSIESDLAEQRALQKAEALERLKEQMLEERAQKDAAKAIEVDERASKIFEGRAAKQLETDAGKLASNAQKIAGDSPAMTAEEMRAHLESLSPAERKAVEGTGLVGRSMTRNEQRMQLAEDSVQAARELGASSTLLKSYQDTKKSVLDAIKEENRERKEDRRYELDVAREDRRDRESRDRYELGQRQAAASERRADAAMVAANRPRSGGADPASKPATTADIQRQINAAKDDIALELGATKSDVNGAIATVKKRAAAGDAKAKQQLEAIQPYLDELKDANDRMRQFKRSANENSASPPSSKGGDNSNVKRDYRNLWN